MKAFVTALAILVMTTVAFADDDGLATCLDGKVTEESNQEIAIACDYALRNAPMDNAMRAQVHLKLGIADRMHVIVTKLRRDVGKLERDEAKVNSAQEILIGSFERAVQNLEHAATRDSAVAPQATYLIAEVAQMAGQYAKADTALTSLIERGQDVWDGFETQHLRDLYHQRGKVRCANGQPEAALADIKKGVEIGGEDRARYWQQTLAQFKKYDGAIDGSYNPALDAAFKKAIQTRDMFVCALH